MEPILFLQDVEYSYPNRMLALSCSELKLESGSHLFVHGPSGSGKTTLLSLIAGITSPQKGIIRVLGHDITKLSPRQRDAFRAEYEGYIFQQFNLIPHLSVRDNILLPLMISRKNVERPAPTLAELVETLDLQALLHKPAMFLSIGQQQRVAAARCFIHAPPLIIADEPTSALDQKQKNRFLNLLFQMALSYGCTIIMVSHDLTLKTMFNHDLDLTIFNRVLYRDHHQTCMDVLSPPSSIGLPHPPSTGP